MPHTGDSRNRNRPYRPPPHPKRLRPAFLTPGVGGRNEMYSETLSHPLNDLDRYLTYDANEPRGSLPSPDPTWLEVEMKIRLANGNQVTVTEHVESMADLGEALEKARLAAGRHDGERRARRGRRERPARRSALTERSSRARRRPEGVAAPLGAQGAALPVGSRATPLVRASRVRSPEPDTEVFRSVPLAADYPFLDLFWTMSIFFVGADLDLAPDQGLLRPDLPPPRHVRPSSRCAGSSS